MRTIVKAGSQYAMQLAHYPSLVASATDFDSEVETLGTFLSGDGIDLEGSGYDYDYIDIEASSNRPATKMTIYAKATGGNGELLIAINPSVHNDDDENKDEGFNFNSQTIHRILCVENENIVYELERTPLTGINIGYNAGDGLSGAEVFKRIIIQIS